MSAKKKVATKKKSTVKKAKATTKRASHPGKGTSASSSRAKKAPAKAAKSPSTATGSAATGTVAQAPSGAGGNVVNKQPQSKQQAAEAHGMFLYTDDAWSQRYFDQNDLHCKERELLG